VTSRQAEAIALGLQLGSISLSLRSLSAEPDKPDGAVASSKETDRSYTRDVDVYYMLDDSQGTDSPDGETRKVQILRGSTAELVSF
jgi:Flp pilus assembly protein CpaB